MIIFIYSCKLLLSPSMTPRSLWTILLKVYGISILIQAFTIIPQLIGSAYMMATSVNSGDSVQQNTFLAVGIILSTIFFYSVSIWIFIYKTDWLIDKLSLDKHFKEETLEINIHRSTIFQIATIVLGGLLFVESLPEFCRQVFSFYQNKSIFRESASANWIIFQFVKMTVGYLLITNSNRISSWFEIKRRRNKLQ